MTNVHAPVFIERQQSMKPLPAKWKLRCKTWNAHVSSGSHVRSF